MGQLTHKILVYFAVYLTISTAVSSAPAEHTDDVGEAQRNQIEASRNAARLLKTINGYNFNRNIRAPIGGGGGGQRIIPVAIPHTKFQPLEIDLVVDDDDMFDKSKRYDDYGHMRFGKRQDERFDDYGHMRFGKRDE